MKTGQGFLLVFSISSRTSFEELETLRDDIIRIRDDDKIPIVIVGNKADLERQRAVDRAKAFSLSQRWEAPYYEASARTRSKCHWCACTFCVPKNALLTPPFHLIANVDEAFTDLCRQMLRRDDSNDEARDDPSSQRSEDWASRRRRRRKRKEKCTIL